MDDVARSPATHLTRWHAGDHGRRPAKTLRSGGSCLDQVAQRAPEPPGKLITAVGPGSLGGGRRAEARVAGSRRRGGR